MLNKLLLKNSTKASKKQVAELQKFFDEIDAKQKEVADKKAQIRDDYEHGSRITKHRFTI